MSLRIGSISSCAIPRRSVVLRTNPFYCRSRGIISTARKCARTGKPDYSRMVQKVGNLQMVDFRRWSKRSKITEPQVADFEGGCKSRFAAGSPGSQGKVIEPMGVRSEG